MSGLVALGRDPSRGTTFELPSVLDLHDLRPNDALLLVFPTKSPPREDLSAFLHAGGRLAIADDFGESAAFLIGFEIGRTRPAAIPDVPRLRGNRNVLIASPRVAHPLTRDVSAVVVNHPSILHHPSLEPVLALGESGGAVMLAGAVGEGRLIVLSDPSALIDNMLQLRGNRQLAINLLDYLGQNGGRIFLVTPKTRLTGRYGALGENDRFERVRAALSKVARIELPPSALRVLSAVLVLAMLLACVGAVPQRAHYLAALARTRPGAPPGLAGDAGAVALFQRPGQNLLVPLLRYRHGLMHALSERVRLEHGERASEAPWASAGVRAIVEGARGMGLAARHVGELRDLLDELASLALEADRGDRFGHAGTHAALDPSAPRISAQKFRAIVARGERMLQLLDAAAGSARSSSSFRASRSIDAPRA